MLRNLMALALGCGSFLVAGCLEEKPADPTPGPILPVDVTKPDGDDAAPPPPPSTDIDPLPASQFVFQSGTNVLAYDLATNSQRVLFDSKDVSSSTTDLSPDRKWLAVTSRKDQLPNGTEPVWAVSVDGRQWKRLYRSAVMSAQQDTLFINYWLYNPMWSSDGAKVFYILDISILNTVPFGTRRTLSPGVAVLGGAGHLSTCNGVEVRSKPTDANAFMVFQTEKCHEMAAGLNEFKMSTLEPTRVLVPYAEVGIPYAADWLHDGSGVVYSAKEGLTRLDLATGAKNVIFKPADPKTSITTVAVGPADEIIVVLKQPTADPKKFTFDLHRVFPETGMATALTTNGTSYGPSW